MKNKQAVILTLLTIVVVSAIVSFGVSIAFYISSILYQPES